MEASSVKMGKGCLLWAETSKNTLGSDSTTINIQTASRFHIVNFLFTLFLKISSKSNINIFLHSYSINYLIIMSWVEPLPFLLLGGTSSILFGWNETCRGNVAPREQHPENEVFKYIQTIGTNEVLRYNLHNIWIRWTNIKKHQQLPSYLTWSP